MGLLDGGIADLFSRAFGGLFLGGTAHQGTGRPIYAAGRIIGYADTGDLPVRVQTDRASQEIRRDPDYANGDVLLIVLKVTPATAEEPTVEVELTTDHQVTDGYGDRYRLMTAELDAARSHWICRGRPV
jgi:hypothetical protein